MIFRGIVIDTQLPGTRLDAVALPTLFYNEPCNSLHTVMEYES
jgi:hypothetical protein